MKLSFKGQYVEKYEDKLLKQSNPYAFYIKEYEQKRRGVLDSSPLFSISEYDEFGDAKEYIKALREMLKDEEKTYIVLVNQNGEMSEGDARLLVGHCTKASYPDVIYCDEDKIDKDTGKRFAPFLKPDFSPHTLLNSNYIGNAFAILRTSLDIILSLIEEDMPRESDFTCGMLVYEILLRVDEEKGKMAHVTDILYHGYFSENLDPYSDYVEREQTIDVTAIRKRAFARRGYRDKLKRSLSIIIPSKDHADILMMCIESLRTRATYLERGEVEIIVVDNGSSDEEKNRIEAYLRESGLNFKYIYEKMDFNYAYMCNLGAKEAKGEFLLFLNDDIEVYDGDFIEKMLTYAVRSEVGAVGIKLLYPLSDLIQHIGVTDLVSGPSHMLSHHSDSLCQYYGINRITGNSLAVTGACLLIGREKFFEVDGFHDKMKVSYNDVDLCVSLYEKGLFNVCIRDRALYHHESLSRGDDLDDAKFLRLSEERKLYYDRHSEIMDGGDPFFNPLLDQDSLDYHIGVVPDCNNRFLNSILEERKIKTDQNKSALFTLEECSVTKGIDGRSKSLDIQLFSGWALVNKKDNRKYDRYLCLIPVNSMDSGMKLEKTTDALTFRVFDKYRADVGNVFREAKYTELSGFVCRVDRRLINPSVTYRVAMLFMQGDRQKYFVIGDLYAADRGSFTAEA